MTYRIIKVVGDAVDVRHLGSRSIPKHKCYEIDESEAESVRYVFSSISEGKSYNAVIADLNDKGFRTRSGNLFGKNSLYDMLHNEKYKVVYIYSGFRRSELRLDLSGRTLTLTMVLSIFAVLQTMWQERECIPIRLKPKSPSV